ncbi:hypothetical protein EPN42_08060 [bacterium]|nr:MAG: hypothetical protein EPN42_08060 [bacterium]
MATLNRDACRSLDEIRRTFDLSEAELGQLLGVQRTSVIGWREHGIPSARRASVARLRDLAGVLERELIPSRIPEIVRTPDAWLGGKTILETIRSDGPEAVYGYLHRLFAYSG